MNIILLSGGSGKRLWPLSNDARSKQFLKILSNEQRQLESMVQRICRQIHEAHIEADITIATGGTQIDSLRAQVGSEVRVVVEPERKNTYPAIALSCAYLLKSNAIEEDDVIIVLPVDPCVENTYFEVFSKMEAFIKEDQADIVLMGIKPTYPSAKYGYIQTAKTNGELYAATGFKEKPSEKEAQTYIEQGAFWNAGVFAFKAKFLLNQVKKEMGTIDYDQLLEKYILFEDISFDYKIVEKTDRLGMLAYDGEWKDLGTWNTLTEEMKSECIGKVITGENCENTHIVNELSIPVIALGTKNLVVVASPDGILVSDKQKSSYLKPYVEELTQRPMYEERRWGEYKVLDYVQYEDKTKSLTKHLTIEAGKGISYQLHYFRDEIWTIVDGIGELLIDGEVKAVKRGDVAYITAGQKHAMRALSNLQFIEVQIGKELVEEDIERFEWEWK